MTGPALRQHNAGAPFYGSQVQRMPSLGSDFIAHVAGLIEAQRPALKPVDQALLQQAFGMFGDRPQFFMAALGQVLSPLAALTGRFEHALLESAQQQQTQDEANMESDYLGLKPTEQAVLWRMLEQGPRYRPYDAEALRFYRDKTGHPVSVYYKCSHLFPHSRESAFTSANVSCQSYCQQNNRLRLYRLLSQLSFWVSLQ